MNIIMICTGNTCRSPMAEALMRRALIERGFEGASVSSAGVSAFAGERASAEAIRQMADMGLDISGHRARDIRDVALDGALVLCMTEGHVRAVLRVAPDADVRALMDYAGLGGDVPDPIGRGSDAYERCARQMARAAQIIADQIAKGL